MICVHVKSSESLYFLLKTIEFTGIIVKKGSVHFKLNAYKVLNFIRTKEGAMDGYMNYETIFKTYHLTNANKKQKQTMRHRLKTMFKNTFNGEKWENLDDASQEYFIYDKIKDIMLKYVLEYRSKRYKQVEAEINKKCSEKYFEATEAIRSHNQAITHLYDTKKEYIERALESDSSLLQPDLENKAYNIFCKQLGFFSKSFFQDRKKLIPPSKEDWLESERGFSIYDIYMSYLEENAVQNSYNPINVSQAEIDHEILYTIVEILKKEFRIQINIDEIRNNLIRTIDSALDVTEPYTTDIENDNMRALQTKQIIDAQIKKNNREFYEKIEK